MLAPSKATPYGLFPTAKLVGWLAWYQESRPTWSGLKYVPETTPLAANCVGANSASCALELAGNIRPATTPNNRTDLRLLDLLPFMSPSCRGTYSLLRWRKTVQQ